MANEAPMRETDSDEHSAGGFRRSRSRTGERDRPRHENGENGKDGGMEKKRRETANVQRPRAHAVIRAVRRPARPSASPANRRCAPTFAVAMQSTSMPNETAATSGESGRFGRLKKNERYPWAALARDVGAIRKTGPNARSPHKT
ncbi:hypothetical protein J6366_13310 [Burkholderia pseudomallei]|nr:hypothetical protein [Burkholderia pseudomallei]